MLGTGSLRLGYIWQQMTKTMALNNIPIYKACKHHICCGRLSVPQYLRQVENKHITL